MEKMYANSIEVKFSHQTFYNSLHNKEYWNLFPCQNLEMQAIREHLIDGKLLNIEKKCAN